MAEVDVNKVKVGQTAEITLDAVPDATLTGTVSLIAPAGVQSRASSTTRSPSPSPTRRRR